MGIQAAVNLGHMPWALTKEEEEEQFKYSLLVLFIWGLRNAK
jgi:hypothetical protein